MNSVRRFKSLVLITAVSSVLGFSVADQRPLLAMLVVAAALIGAFLTGPLPRLTLNFLVLAATANAAVSVLRERQELIAHLTTYLCLILIIKIFDRGRMRDEAQLLGLSIFVVIGSVLTGQSFLLGIMLVIYTILAMVAVVLYQVHAGTERHRQVFESAGARLSAEQSPLTGRSRRQLAGTIAVGLVMSLAAAVVSFVITPRGLVQQFLGSVGQVAGGAQTGFRPDIKLGEGGYINVSSEPVMDIVLRDDRGEIIRDRSEVLYLRGAVLTHYQAQDRQWIPHKLEHDGSGARRDIFDSAPLTGGGALVRGGSGRQTLRQEITIRNAPNSSSPLFAAWRPTAIKLDPPRRFSVNRQEGLLQITASGRVSYVVDSTLDYREDAGSAALAGTDRDPGAFAVGPIRDHAQRLARGAGVLDAASSNDPAQVRRLCNAIIADLRGSYKYSLENAPPPVDRDPIEYFLFDAKRGHCEYFASAMVAMLQSLGVQARIVTGYAMSEFNPVNDHYTVRQSDAHAWVEVRISPERWETFDPTPPGELNAAQRTTGGFWGRLRHAWDALEFSWIDNVVAYDRGTQIDLLSLTGGRGRDTALLSLRNRITETLDALKHLAPDSYGPLIPVAIGAGLVATLVIPRRSRERLRLGFARLIAWMRGRPATGDPRFVPGTEFYRRMLLLLQRHRKAKPDAVPPLLHARSLDEAAPPLADLTRDVARAYYRIRFAANQPGREELDALTARLRAAERDVEHHR